VNDTETETGHESETTTEPTTSAARSLIAIAALGTSAVGFAAKARRAKGSTDLLDHVDVIAELATLTVLLLRARRRRRAAT
jgi:hypothetical protein